jgi:MarR family transcriptional regulator, organic hydroperoxide resistance regulator
VRRQRNPNDERALAVELTGEGRALRRKALKVPPAIVERLGMDLADLQQIHGHLSRVIAAATRPV